MADEALHLFIEAMQEEFRSRNREAGAVAYVALSGCRACRETEHWEASVTGGIPGLTTWPPPPVH